MAVAERLEQIFQLVGGKDPEDYNAVDGPNDEICPKCHHDKEEHTRNGCFHYDGSEDREYCGCDEPYYSSSLDKPKQRPCPDPSRSAHLSN